MTSEREQVRQQRRKAAEDTITAMSKASDASMLIEAARMVLYHLGLLYQGDPERAEDAETVSLIVGELDRQLETIRI